MMRIAPAAKAFAFARALPPIRSGPSLAALRMMSAAAPGVKVRLKIYCSYVKGPNTVCREEFFHLENRTQTTFAFIHKNDNPSLCACRFLFRFCCSA